MSDPGINREELDLVQFPCVRHFGEQTCRGSATLAAELGLFLHSAAPATLNRDFNRVILEADSCELRFVRGPMQLHIARTGSLKPSHPLKI